jgi:predicted nucleic acid-binding protein
MAVFFFDSNTIVKYYISEPGSNWVRGLVNDKNNSCLICDISLAEVAAAISQMRQFQPFGRAFVHGTIERFQNDVRSGLFLSHPIDTNTLEHAAAIAETHALKGCDAIQVASAALAEENISIEIVFVTGDKQVLRVAQFEALETDNPFKHLDED